MQGLAFRAYHGTEDARVMFDLYSDPFEQALFAQRVPLTTPFEFQEWLEANLRDQYHEFRVVACESTGDLAGFMFAYDYRPFDLHCKVCLYMRPMWRSTGAGAIMGARFLADLFCAYPLRKVYALVYDYNNESLHSNLKAGFREEGCLEKYRYLNGAYHDCHVLSLDRRTFEERLAPLVNEEAKKA